MNFNYKKGVLLLLAFTTCFANGAPAQAKKSLSEITDQITVDAEVRVRPEFRHNMTQALPSVPGAVEEDLSVLLRSRLGFQFEPTDHLRFYLQMEDARDFGEEVGTFATAAGDDEGLDLHQGFIEYANVGDGPFSFRIGRQELVFGEERLIGNGYWFQVGRSFDGGLMTYDEENWKFDLFATMANKSLPGDQVWFGGAYTTWKGFPDGVLDFYYLLLQDNNGAAGVAAGTGDTLSTHTVGFRIKSEPGMWDLGTEIAAQFGKFGSNTILAYAGHAHVGYTFEETHKPKLLFGYNYASGNDGANNRYSKFNNLFPTNHLHHGNMDFAVWSNIHDGYADFSVLPFNNGKWKLSLAYRLLMVDKTAGDTFAGIAGTGNGKLAGHEGDFVLNYIWNEYAKFQLGYGHLIPGSYLKNAGVTQHSDFGYLQAIASF